MKNIEFGLYDSRTGKSQSGYINKNGEMRYKNNWWKNLFCRPPHEIEYLGTTIYNQRFLWYSNFDIFEAPVYKDYNPITGEIYEMYALIDGKKYQLEPKAYPKMVPK